MNAWAGWRIAALTTAVTLASAQSFGQDAAESYPRKQIRLILPQTPGAATDVIARAVGQKLSEAWGQPIVVDNRSGASGNIGTALAARAAPDGYTLLFGTVGMLAINPSLYKNVGFDPRKDFAPVALLGIAPVVVIAHPSLSANSITELVQLAKAKPGQLSHGSAGNGTPGHLIMEALKQATQIQMTHVPYKGAAPALTAILGGEIPLTTTGVGSAIAHIGSGRVKPLAIANRSRLQIVPTIPTLRESGVVGVDDLLNWYALFAPAGTSPAIVRKINAEAVRALQSSSVQELFYKSGYESSSDTPQQFSKYYNEQITAWSRIVRTSGATVD